MLVDVQTISIVIAASGLFIAAINQILSNRRAERQRQTNLFMRLYDRFNDIEFAKQWSTLRWLDYEWNSYDEFIQKYSARTNFEVFNATNSVGRYFEGVGVLVEKGLINLDLVNSLLYKYVAWYWIKHESMFKEHRKQYDDPLAWDHVEYLYTELKKHQPHAPTVRT